MTSAQALTELALNLRWSWNRSADELWAQLDAELRVTTVFTRQGHYAHDPQALDDLRAFLAAPPPVQARATTMPRRER